MANDVEEINENVKKYIREMISFEAEMMHFEEELKKKRVRRFWRGFFPREILSLIVGLFGACLSYFCLKGLVAIILTVSGTAFVVYSIGVLVYHYVLMWSVTRKLVKNMRRIKHDEAWKKYGLGG